MITRIGDVANGITIAEDTDGSLIVAGVAGGDGHDCSAAHCNFGVFRHGASGALVPGFGQSGVVSFDAGPDLSGEWHTLLLQPDRSIVVGGTLHQRNPFAQTGRVVRYSAAGVQDNTFGPIVEANVDVKGSLFQPDGKLVLVGSLIGSSQTTDFWVARYTTEGARDDTFGTAGVVTADFNLRDEATTAVLVAGNKHLVVGTGQPPDLNPFLALARFSADGTPDLTFGTNGLFVNNFGFGFEEGTTNNNGSFGLAIDAFGRIIVGANVGNPDRMVIARLWP